ncbi:hypothetical protein ACVIWV_002008 [Bradyrhizobium diazoefficiens]|uniref:hypothetical protein n=1 Tax=Bradyrhizobium TaxID=374 RepID=UPI000765F8CE|nr:hypothetical protein [Bradyrhizobium diazoefficiens]MBR0868301.1 hypothetical protein [Bradyrhizobium diazoefficiens]MBR0892831.1 hypothetical protein [Bradyrhizobium diazoefficiens]MBR0924516.1 hypothetical protein [Bradyrhizobium diazoefficiens]
MAKATQKHEPTLARFAVGLGGLLSQSETVVGAFGRDRGFILMLVAVLAGVLVPLGTVLLIAHGIARHLG